MTAVLLNKLFIAALLGVIVATCVSFYFAAQFLRETALQTARVKADIAVMSDDMGKLKRLETEMEEKSEIVSRAHQIVSESSTFQHQNQIVQDITAYAAIAGVEVAGFSFAQEPTSTTPQTTGSTPAVSGVKTLDATVTLKTPIQYDSYLRFLKAIEKNLTKMQVTGVNMTPASDNPNLINSPTVGLQIYVKE